MLRASHKRAALFCDNLSRFVLSIQSSLLHDESSVPRVIPNYHKKRFKVHNYGYHLNIQTLADPYPRQSGDMQRVTRPNIRKEFTDQWTDNPLSGRNDYIDLLGDGTIHPAQLLYHVPRWLKGFPGEHRANEMVRLIHYRNIYGEKMRRDWPRRWHELIKRIKWLSSYHNYKKQDEINNERDLGLWKEKPDFHYKDKKLRSFQDIV